MERAMCWTKWILYLKLATGGRGVSPEIVHELQERYAQIGLGDEPQFFNELVGQVCGFLKPILPPPVFVEIVFKVG
jgi:hypothetical protein